MPLFLFDSWLNAILLDRWSLLHFLVGIILALLFRMLRLRTIHAFVLAFAFMFVWEVYEELWGGVEELVWNAISDIVVASFGFWLVHRFLPVYRFYRDATLGVLLSLVMVWLIVISGA